MKKILATIALGVVLINANAQTVTPSGWYADNTIFQQMGGTATAPTITIGATAAGSDCCAAMRANVSPALNLEGVESGTLTVSFTVKNNSGFAWASSPWSGRPFQIALGSGMVWQWDQPVLPALASGASANFTWSIPAAQFRPWAANNTPLPRTISTITLVFNVPKAYTGGQLEISNVTISRTP